jgi:hypothetical protein
MLLLANICIAIFSLHSAWRFLEDDILKIFGFFIFITITQVWPIAFLMLFYLAIFYTSRLAYINSVWCLILKLIYAVAVSFLLTIIWGQMTSIKESLSENLPVYLPTGIILVLIYEKYLKENIA